MVLGWIWSGLTHAVNTAVSAVKKAVSAATNWVAKSIYAAHVVQKKAYSTALKSVSKAVSSAVSAVTRTTETKRRPPKKPVYTPPPKEPPKPPKPPTPKAPTTTRRRKPPSIEKPSEANITIKVYDSVSGEPVEGAAVSIYDHRSSRALTDSHGKLIFKSYPFGRYTIAVQHSDYETYRTSLSHFSESSLTVKLKRKPETKTALQKQWEDFFKHPDVIKAFGLIPSAVQNSFAKVFGGYDIIQGKPAKPELGDYLSVASILAGVGVGALAGILSLIPGGATAAVTTGLTGVTELYEAGKTSEALSLAEKSFGSFIRQNPGATYTLFSRIRETFLGPGFLRALLLLMAIQQLDVIGWGFGLMPEPIHRKIKDSLSYARSYLISLENALKRGDYETARTMVASIKEQLRIAKEQISSLPADFYKKFGFTMHDLQAQIDTIENAVDEYIKRYPALAAPVVSYPEVFSEKVAEIIDGDTIKTETGKIIRIVGIDAHEKGTPAGKEEAEYLESLIDRSVLTFKTDPHNQVDQYGRILAVPFLNGRDITLDMLKRFGKEILISKRYRKKHKYVDWDAYERAARGFIGPTGKIKIYSKPAYASIWVDGKDTGKITIETLELPVGKHEITIKKPGYLDYTEVVEIKEGELIERRYELEPAPVGAAPGAAPGAEKFTIYIDSVPTRARLYIDGIYTHHLTPSNEKELSDVKYLLTPGKHKIKVAKKIYGRLVEVEKEVDIKPGANPPIILNLLEAAAPSAGTPGEERAEAGFKIFIDSVPTRARLWIDGIYTHHLTPSDEKELSDVMYLLTPGKHIIKCTKKVGRYLHMGMKEVEIKEGDNGKILIELKPVI